MTTPRRRRCLTCCDRGHGPTPTSDERGPAAQQPQGAPTRNISRYEWRADCLGRLIWVDPICEQIRGQPSDALQEYRFLDHVHPDDRARIEHTYRHGVERRMVTFYGCRIFTVFGVTTARATVTPCYSDGVFSGFRGSTIVDLPVDASGQETGTG